MNVIQIGDVVRRNNKYSKDVGDVVEKDGNRCRVMWRDREVPSFHRPGVIDTRKGKRTWVRQDRLERVS